MFAGLLGLAFNPSAWIAVGLALFIGFSSGVIKGWADSGAAQYKAEVAALRRAATQKDAIIKANADRYLEDRAEKSRLEAELQDIINANSQTDACKLSASELARLRGLARR